MLLYVVLDKLYFVLPERDRTFCGRAVLQWCLLIGPMADIETSIGDVRDEPVLSIRSTRSIRILCHPLLR